MNYLLVLYGFFPGFHNSLNTNPERNGILDSILTSEQFCMNYLLVLYGFFPGFHNSLNTNPKRSGTSDSILTFEQFAIISWFCMASFPQLLVLCSFHNSLNTNPKRSGTSDFILTFVQEQLSVSYGTRTSI